MQVFFHIFYLRNISFCAPPIHLQVSLETCSTGNLWLCQLIDVCIRSEKLLKLKFWTQISICRHWLNIFWSNVVLIFPCWCVCRRATHTLQIVFIIYLLYIIIYLYPTNECTKVLYSTERVANLELTEENRHREKWQIHLLITAALSCLSCFIPGSCCETSHWFMFKGSTPTTIWFLSLGCCLCRAAAES